MAKRYSDTNKWKKPFIRSLQGAYKLLWFYILDDCDHAGIWQVDQDVAELRVGMQIDWEKVPEIFKNKIVFIDESKWFVPDFIEFQYGPLNPQNRVHFSVISLLEKYGLSKFLEKNKELISPLQGAKDKDKDKDKEKDKEIEGGMGETNTTITAAETSEITEDFEDKTRNVPLEFPEEEFIAATEKLKGSGEMTLIRMQHEKDVSVIEKHFRVFYEQKLYSGEMSKYKNDKEFFQNFYYWIPKYKISQKQNEPKQKSNGNKNRTNTTSVPAYQPNF